MSTWLSLSSQKSLSRNCHQNMKLNVCMTWLPLSTSSVPLLFPLISCVLFIYFALIYPLTQNQCVNPLNFRYLFTSTFKMYLPLSLFTRKGTNNSRMFTIIQFIHPSSYLPFFSSKRTCVMIIYIVIFWVFLQWNTLSFYYSILAIDESTHALRTFVPDGK